MRRKARPEQRYLAGGSAGVLLAIAELVGEFGEGRHQEALTEGIEWLRASGRSGISCLDCTSAS